MRLLLLCCPLAPSAVIRMRKDLHRRKHKPEGAHAASKVLGMGLKLAGLLLEESVALAGD